MKKVGRIVSLCTRTGNLGWVGGLLIALGVWLSASVPAAIIMIGILFIVSSVIRAA